MPTKNRDKLISKAVQSIIDQTEKDWELIIVDDNSAKTDKTEKIIKNFRDSRIKYHRLPKNWPAGQSAARNFGNQLVSSPIIAVADSDDYNYPERAALTIKAFEENNIDVFYAQIEIYNEETKILQNRVGGKYPVTKFDLKKLKAYNLIPHASAAYKTEIAYDFPYNSFFRMAADFDLFSRLAKAKKKFYFCPEIVFRCILHKTNNTRIGIPGNFGKLIKINRGWDNGDKQEILEKMIVPD